MVKWFDDCMVDICDLYSEAAAWLNKGAKWNDGDICPTIKDVLHKNQGSAAEFIPRKSNEWNYEIIGASIMNNWAVDLLNRKCSCREWNLT